MNYDVFISYAHEEVKTARRLADALIAARGWSVWWDTSLRTGEQYPRKIQEAVGASRSVVVLWSKDSTTSNWVVAEASEGWNRKVLVPVLLDGSEPPMPFRQTQARDFSTWGGGLRDAALLGLIEDIQRVHALGPEVSAAELAEREARRRAYQRKLWLRRGAYAAAVLVVLLGGWFGWQSYRTHARVNAEADRLARQADAVRAEALKQTPEEEKKIWWVNLNSARLRQLKLSTLLAIEAVKYRSTEHGQRSLRDSFALLPATGKQLRLDYDDLPLALSFNRNGRLLAAGGGAKGTLIWDVDADAVIARIDHGGTGGVDRWQDRRATYSESRRSRQVVDFNPARDEVATAGPDSTARIWDARSGRELHRLKLEALVTAVAFDADGRRLATSDEGGSVCIWDSASGQQLHCMQQGAPTYSIRISPSGALLASVSTAGAVDLWNTGNGALVRRIATEKGIEGARFDSEEKVLATFGEDATTRLWNIASGAETWKLSAKAARDAGVVFDQSGKTLVVGQTNGELSWWDIATRTRRFTTTMDALYTLAMVSAGSSPYFVSISNDEEARVWDLQTGQLIRRLTYADDVMGVALTRDGQRFAVLGADDESRMLEVMETRPADAVAAACENVGRNLTRNEWRQYLENEPYRLTCAAYPEGEEVAAEP
jgi:WD40 repeat protein